MAYSSLTDFIGLLRQTANGMRAVRMPGLDYVVEALQRAGMFQISVGQSQPVTNQSITVWFRPAVPSYVSEGVVFLWNPATVEYEVATPALWNALFLAVKQQVTQNVAVAGPTNVQTNADVVLVQNVGASVALVMPLSSTKANPVLISDWANHAGTNNITITLTGGDVFPNGAVTQIIAADSASVFLRPVPGGYTL